MPAVTTAVDKEKRATLTIYGNLTIRNAGQLVDAFDKLFNQDVTHYTVDFTKVAYLDSTGVSCILRMKQRLDEVEGTLNLVQVSEAAMDIFRATRLDSILHLQPAGTRPPPPPEGG